MKFVFSDSFSTDFNFVSPSIYWLDTQFFLLPFWYWSQHNLDFIWILIPVPVLAIMLLLYPMIPSKGLFHMTIMIRRCQYYNHQKERSLVFLLLSFSRNLFVPVPSSCKITLCLRNVNYTNHICALMPTWASSQDAQITNDCILIQFIYTQIFFVILSKVNSILNAHTWAN